MRKQLFLLSIFLTGYVHAQQTLNSVTPNTALTGTTLTAQISGSNTLFQSSSPQGLFLEQGLSTIYASLFSINVIDEENMIAEFTIPPNTPTGIYNLQYSFIDTGSTSNIISLSLPNAVTIILPFYISGNVFLDLNNNGVKDAGENGVMGQKINIMPDNQNFFSNSSGVYSIPTYAGNKTITFVNTTAQTGYTLSTGSQTSYSGNFTTGSSGYDFGVINGGEALVSLAPDSAMAGTKLNAIVSAIGTTLLNSSPQGAINYLFFTKPGTNINTYGSAIVLNDTTFEVTVNFPPGTPLGFLDLVVSYTNLLGNTMLLSLPSSVYIYPPDIFLEGTAYADRDSNAIQDITEPGIANQSITIQPDNQTFVTNQFGEYKIPTNRGNKSITITPSSGNVINPLASATISGNYQSSTQNLDFPLLGPGPFLTTIAPNTVLAGTTLQALISGYGTTFQSSSPPSSIVGAAITKTNPFAIYPVLFNTISVIDDEHFNADFTIPANALSGLYNLEVTYETAPFNYITLTLPNSVTINQPQLFLEGYTYLDINNNGIKDGGEPGMSGQKVTIQPDNQYVFSDLNGFYSAGSYPGTHTITWDSTGSSLTLSAASQASYTTTVSQTTGGFDFGLLSSSPPFKCDVTSLWGIKRCNTTNYFSVTYQNTGIITYNARLKIIKSSNTTFSAGSVTPASINGDTIIYNLNNLLAQQTGSLYFNLGMPGAGSFVSIKAIMESLDGLGNVMDSDTLTDSGNVTCSFDPNDKAVTPAGVQSSNYTLMNETLSYLIRFQNTGNDTAFTVVIRDTVDTDLNLSTFKLIAASHAVQTQIDVNTRIVTFTFNNILLVDSNMNEPLSHGFVRYTIKPNAGLLNLTTIENTAYIYFDFNDPVATNTTFNTMVYSIPTSIPEINFNEAGIVRVMPNPFSDKTNIVFDNALKNKYRLVVVNIQGKIVIDEVTESDKIQVHKNNLNTGLYLFKLVPLENGKSYSGKFVIN